RGGQIMQAAPYVHRTGHATLRSMRLDLTNAEWRRSPASADGDESAVEVAILPDGDAVRDSRKPDGDVLYFTPAEWDAFVGGAELGFTAAPLRTANQSARDLATLNQTLNQQIPEMSESWAS